jgi:parallel beta helix pectate lyase-like protein
MKFTVFAAALCAVATTATAAGATVNVANNGLDSATCGTRSAPCRSIGRGIERASPGDTVLVGPGKYGDLNDDGFLSGAGEEVSSGTAAVRIGKPLRVVSSAGAVLTVIDAGGGVFWTVDIASDGVTFGVAGGGFTMVGGQFQGLNCTGQTNLRIGGNIASGSPGSGFVVYSKGYVEMTDNIAHGNASVGFIIGSELETSRVVLRNNQSYGNNTGILSATRGRHEIAFNEVSNNTNQGISVDYTPAYIHHNIVTGNAIGIASNSWSPDNPPSSGPVLYRNSLIGNTRFGIFLQQGPVRTVVKENNFFGNGTTTSELVPNCGLANFTGETLNAVNSYWGAPIGPGAEPADVACGNGPVITTPFARSPN